MGKKRNSYKRPLFSWWRVSELPYKWPQSCKPAVYLLRAMADLKGRCVWLRAAGHPLRAIHKLTYSHVSRRPPELGPWTRAEQLLEKHGRI